MWERRQCWALSFRVGLPTRGNNTNNYIERSFGILKDIMFARTQAYNCVQVFQFITTNMERFYALRLLSLAHRHQGAVSVKFHISTFNFLPSLTSNDRMLYAYIALGNV